jgi:hypothetical protein
LTGLPFAVFGALVTPDIPRDLNLYSSSTILLIGRKRTLMIDFAIVWEQE